MAGGLLRLKSSRGGDLPIPADVELRFLDPIELMETLQWVRAKLEVLERYGIEENPISATTALDALRRLAATAEELMIIGAGYRLNLERTGMRLARENKLERENDELKRQVENLTSKLLKATSC